MRTLTIVLCLLPAFAAGEQVNPYPRRISRVEKVHEWTFAKGPAGWGAQHACTVAARGGRLHVSCSGEDPYLAAGVSVEGGALLVRLRMKSNTGGQGQLFWSSDKQPGMAERHSQRFNMDHDGAWHDYDVPIRVVGRMTGLRLDPGAGAGEVAVERIEILRRHMHPLEIAAVRAAGATVNVTVKNHSASPITFSVAGRTATAEAGKAKTVAIERKPAAPFETLAVTVTSQGLPTLSRPIHLYELGLGAKWLTLKSPKLIVRVAPDGSGAALVREEQLLGALTPIVTRDGEAVSLTAARDGEQITLTGKGLRATLRIDGDELAVSIRSDRPCEGPRLRAFGALEQGLFAGLEYLGKGERSSSALDIETAERLRFAPDPMKVTMPLMACVTRRGAAAMAWKDMSLRPVFASPNFFDGTSDHLMSLRGKRIDATIAVRERQNIEELILWAVGKCPLPPLPKAPRTRKQQWELCLKSLSGPIAGEGGWGHCAEPKWGRAPYADVASTIFRLTGRVPELPRLQPGGAHVRNDAAYFLTGRAGDWLKMRGGQARANIRRQKPDGSYRYEGKYRRGHFEDTASGLCARPAYELLEFAHQAGDKAALAAGLKTLEYIKRFRTPRGAQTWELSLHTPDVLASGYLVAAYVRGYELTGRKDLLAEARRWALSGVPFVYLWSNKPVMAYASPPVYGATNWRAPNWIGLPVQWCGGVYAYWLTKLAAHDKTLDWRRLAEGILIAGEQMQYPDGPKIGCLPDVFNLAGQHRAGPSINPCAMASLRIAVAGELDSLAVATDASHRVTAPFDVSIRDGKAVVRVKAGTAYQVLVDGRRIVDVRSKGTDVIDLAK